MGPSSGPSRPDAELVPDVDSESAMPQEASTGDPAMTTAHLARFEFSDAGTKILMVEWHPDGTGAAGAVTTGADTPDGGKGAGTPTRATATGSGNGSGAGGGDGSGNYNSDAATKPPTATGSGSGSGSEPLHDHDTVWQVSWPGKSTTLPARDNDTSTTSALKRGNGGDPKDDRRRVYFLLPPDAAVPATVTITTPGQPSIEVKPLPAIFPEGFLDAESSGPRGVLHTIWAKKRLSELEREMDAEMRANAESVAVEMALAEKQWIIDNFLRTPIPVASPSSPASYLHSPTTPRSPITGRLGEKLKGLRLATSPNDLIPSPTANTFTSAGSQSHTLSPQGSDIAVSSFSSIPRPADRKASAVPRSAVDATAGTVSLDAALKGDGIAPVAPLEHDEDLFALPISPRSPEMKKSPFSNL